VIQPDRPVAEAQIPPDELTGCPDTQNEGPAHKERLADETEMMNDVRQQEWLREMA